jgi:hypothetical protein
MECGRDLVVPGDDSLRIVCFVAAFYARARLRVCLPFLS